jgi:hypothetical protein
MAGKADRTPGDKEPTDSTANEVKGGGQVFRHMLRCSPKAILHQECGTSYVATSLNKVRQNRVDERE